MAIKNSDYIKLRDAFSCAMNCLEDEDGNLSNNLSEETKDFLNEMEKTATKKCDEILRIERKEWNKFLNDVESEQLRRLADGLFTKLQMSLPSLTYPRAGVTLRTRSGVIDDELQMVWEKNQEHVSVTIRTNATFDWFYSDEARGILQDGEGDLDAAVVFLLKALGSKD